MNIEKLNILFLHKDIFLPIADFRVHNLKINYEDKFDE